jgi:DNA-3-methyladenine glycosylase
MVKLHHHARVPAGQPRTDIRNQLFEGPTICVAQRLVGATLTRVIPEGEPDAGLVLRGRIVETEAYLPIVDPASHGYRGPTPRTSTLFGRPGFAYVYLIYGMYYCLNATTEPPGIGAAVLVRAMEPLEGIEAMRRRRGQSTPTEALASGPGNLCRALSIDMRCDRADLRSGPLTIEPAEAAPIEIATSERIGLSSAQSWPLRFFDPKSPSVSPYRARRRPQDRPARSR